MPKLHQMTQLAQELTGELRGDAQAIAQDLLLEVMADSVQLPRGQFLAWVRRNWLTDPQFPGLLLERLAPKGPGGLRPLAGVKGYVAAVEQAFKEQPAAEDGAPAPDAGVLAAAQRQQAAQGPGYLPLQLSAGGVVGAVPPPAPPTPPVGPLGPAGRVGGG